MSPRGRAKTTAAHKDAFFKISCLWRFYWNHLFPHCLESQMSLRALFKPAAVQMRFSKILFEDILNEWFGLSAPSISSKRLFATDILGP